jgi:drug/metabolite transporter (DMT)-like permease
MRKADAVVDPSTRLRGLAIAVWRFIAGAPLTYSWLIALLVTTIIRDQHLLPKRQLHALVVDDSSTNIKNIMHLAWDTPAVLIDSLLWIDGRDWTPYPVLFTVFLAPAEHWLGQLRWLTVGLTSHVLATYISEDILYVAIRYHDAPRRLMHATDIGVSYVLVGVMAVLTYRIARPWRWGYLGMLIVIFGVLLIATDRHGLNFTAIGHFTAILIGLCFYPMARKRQHPQWNPAKLGAAFRGSRSRQP